MAEPVEKSKHREIINGLDSFFKNERTVLDIGCNTGKLLDYAKGKGCRTCGVEFCLSRMEKLAGKVHASFAVLETVVDCYDVITAFDLVEHMYIVPEFLRVCRRKLRKKGGIIHLTGDISSLGARLAGPRRWYLAYPEHIVFPSWKYFNDFSGFTLVRWIPTYAPLGYEQSFLRSIYGFLYGKFQGIYAGLPSPGPDHMLVILKNG